MQEHGFDPEEAAVEWQNLENRSIGHAAMYGAKYCTKGGKRAVTLCTATGEMRDDGRGYRTWSASRSWGQRMKSIREEQRVWAAAEASARSVPPAAAGRLDPETDFYATGEDVAMAIVEMLGGVTV
jgi:hypothetical protein